jgi:hypothetical protein
MKAIFGALILILAATSPNGWAHGGHKHTHSLEEHVGVHLDQIRNGERENSGSEDRISSESAGFFYCPSSVKTLR